ncbi:MAG: hypothetical protein KKH22_06650 [Proteobacteria bacterium]|nr:hypothetical protein [Pseudomonadota bacterium]
MKNKLTDLNDHLFCQLERLSDEEIKGEALKEEIERARAVSQVASHIIGNATLVLNAQKALNDGLIRRAPLMMIGAVNEAAE